VSTEWIVLVYFMKYGVTITKFSQMYDAFVRCSNKLHHFAPPPKISVGCGPDYYYKKGVCIQVIRSAVRRYFRGQQHGPTWKCIHPKNKPTKNARKHGNSTKGTSEQHERAI